MRTVSFKNTREEQELVKAQLRATLASWVLSKFPKCIHNSMNAQLKALTNSSHNTTTTTWVLRHVLFVIDYQVLTMHGDGTDIPSMPLLSNSLMKMLHLVIHVSFHYMVELALVVVSHLKDVSFSVNQQTCKWMN